MNMTSSHSHHQNGVAMITVLLVVALATAVLAPMTLRMQVDIRRTQNVINTDQANMYTLSAEDWARRVLISDAKNNNFDHANENWAIALPPIPVEGGQIQGILTDLNGCLNVNALVRNGAAYAPAQIMFRRLLTVLKLNVGLADSLIDWIDDNLDVTIPDGGEDGYYLGLDPPYRAANRYITSISELRLIKGFNEDNAYKKIEPFVCAIPSDEPINVNTAPAEVLISLDNTITQSVADAIILQREDTPYEDITNFFASTVMAGRATAIPDLDVVSNYFLLDSQADIALGRVNMYSIIFRSSNGNTSTISRTRGTQ